MSLIWHQDDWLDALEQPSRLDRMKFAFVILAANLWDFMETRSGKLLALGLLTAAYAKRQAAGPGTAHSGLLVSDFRNRLGDCHALGLATFTLRRTTMKRFFVIEADTAFATVSIHEVTQDFSATVDYHREATTPSLVREFLGPKFYGKLDALLITADKLENAAPIEIEVPAEKVTA